MSAQVTSVFMYVNDVRRSLDFYYEIVGAEISQIHAEHEEAPISLAILRIGNFSLMLHPQEPHASEFANTRVGVGIRLQLRVDDIDAFYQHCLDEGAMLSVLGEPTDQEWGWREFGLKDPDGYVWSIYDVRMPAQVASVFMYVNDVSRSLEFYQDVVGAEISQIHPENEEAPISLAILRIGNFSLMLHPQEPYADEFANTRVGVGIHPQLRVDDIDAFYQHCLDEGAMLSVSGEPTDQEWGWREFALKDPDGYVWSIYQDKTGGRWT
jgi:uncharacterized glyoxalase superfamily protein PhnB